MTPKDGISSSAIDAKLNEFDQKLDRLYRQYEQYFIGIEKRPPRHPRREVARMYRELEQLPMLKTSLKFRFRSLVQRFNSYKSYWNRIERQIEEGTYHRDLARAKARKERREEREQDEEQVQASGRSDDGAFELDEIDLDDLDLSSMEEELQQMDQRGEFEKYVGTKKVKHLGFPEDEKPAEPQPAARDQSPSIRQSDSWQRPEVDEDIKQKRLAELQAKLGLSSRAGSDNSPPERPRRENHQPQNDQSQNDQPQNDQPQNDQPRGHQQASGQDSAPSAGGQNPFSRSAEGPTQKARPENPSAPSRGADISKLRRLRRAKERIEREQGQEGSSPRRTTGNDRSKRVIRRTSSSSGGGSTSSSDERSRKIYDNLVEAKRRCKEDTSNLNYDTFKRTMDRQRTQIQKKKGARDVDFKVVIKEGRAFLKPETKD